jgi:hypothetical protein
MGIIKDIYFHQMQAGDQFTGRCASLLNMFRKDFAASPVMFASTIDESWVDATVKEVFPAFAGVEGMKRILRMCLASLVHNKDEVLQFQPNHIARNAIPIYRDPTKMQPATGKVEIVYAWEANCSISGVPPHIKQLVDLEAICESTACLAQSVEIAVMVGITEYFEVRRIGSGDITEARVKEMIECAVATAITNNTEELIKRFDSCLDTLGGAFSEASGNTGRRAAGPSRSTATFQLRTRGGLLSRLPDNFRFPHSTSYDCWTQWNIGNLERSIPPLRSLVPKEFQFIDIIPKEANERRGQPGKHREKRRPASKQYSDLKLFCKFLEKAASDQGLDTSNNSPQNVRRMFEASENEIRTACGKNKRMDQMRWTTVVKKLRKQMKTQARELAEMSSDDSDGDNGEVDF